MQQPSKYKTPLPPPRGVPKSVSDLYGTTDEIDFLLDEIKDLEPACCQLEDIQVPELEPPPKPIRTRVPNKNKQSPPPSQPAPQERHDPRHPHHHEEPHTPHHHHHHHGPEDHTDDNFILIIPSPKLSSKYNRGQGASGKKVGFLRRVFGRRAIEVVDQQRRIQFQNDKELHEIELKGKRAKKNLVVLAGRVDTEEDEDIVPISIGENDDGSEDITAEIKNVKSEGADDGVKDEEADIEGGKERNDFDIAGSRAGGVSTLDLESPLGTVTSWDSHAFYKQRIGLSQMTWGVQLHCDTAHLKSPTGIFRILLVISSIICLAFECSAGTVQVGLFLLPLIGRLRLMIFCALFSLLVTCLMLFLDISHIALMFPFNWNKVNGWLYLCVGLLFLIGSSLVVHMVLFAEAFSWVPRHTKDNLFVSGLFGYGCAVEAFVLSIIALCSSAKYLQVPEDQNELCERDREMGPMTSNHKSLSHRGKTGKRVSKRDLVNNHIKGGALAGQPMDEGDEEEAEEEDDEDDETDENQVMLNSASGDDVPNHRNHRGSMSSFTHKPYIPAKRPDQAFNQNPTLGHHNAQVKTNSRYRKGYHYQPVAVASTSAAQSPTFILDEDSKAALPGPSTSRSLSADTA